jgi:hypothetical protein
MEIRASDLHAGDWVKSPENKPVWIAVRGRVDKSGLRRFVLGRGGGGSHGLEVEWSDDDSVTLLARWPELPPHQTLRAFA